MSLVLADLLPLGRARITPSALFRSKASLVRWEIRFRSISADKPKANANLSQGVVVVFESPKALPLGLNIYGFQPKIYYF